MKARKVKGLDPLAPLSENAARMIRVRLDELRSFAPAALRPERVTDQHDMRIAAKRLRYVLEATELCFGRPARDARRRARELQEVLGELHDCDVIGPRIEAHAAHLRAADADRVRELAGPGEDLDPQLSARAPHRDAYRGLDLLAVHFAARRRLLFNRFVALWRRTEDERTFERLEAAIGERLRAGPRRGGRVPDARADRGGRSS